MTPTSGCTSSLRHRGLVLLAAALAVLSSGAAGAQTSFVNFESGHVRPLAQSPDGTRLFAVNTPDNRLEVFSVGAGGLTHSGSVPVGLEPVAVAARTNSEVWVVNHLSDSISIVDVASSPPRVVRTLLVGDEPRDIVFAGPGGNRAFITAAHRGQNGGFDPQLTTAGAGRADVWVFDALNLGSSLGGTPLTRVTLFGDTPRALARSADGSKVYAAVFFSGNRTTTLNEGAVCNGGAGAGPCTVSGQTVPGGMPAPNVNFQGVTAPETGLIVKYDTALGQWRDELGRNWNNAVRFNLPDLDVFTIDANASTPVETQSFSDVGTVLFNMIASPTDPDKVYVTNTEARNEVRFEGPGTALNSTTVRGRLHEARITVIDGSTVTPRHLNKHIDYDQFPAAAGTLEKSLATPVGMAISASGQTLYVAAFGSGKVGIFDTTELDANSFVPDELDHVALSAGGPSGLVLDEARNRLYVFTRFDNAISVVDTVTREEIAHLPVYNPEPAEVVTGRPFLYDAAFSSSNGEASCSSCHVFGDLDQLAWDLGNPDDPVTSNPMTIKLSVGAGSSVNGGADIDEFHPMKGPMTTQTLRGMVNSGPMHWRGDRANGFFGVGTDEALSFDNFIVAFEGLLGREHLISTPDMQAFTDFALTLTLPPNPIRNLNNALTADQQAGRNFYNGSRFSDGFPINGLGFNCNGCHTLDASQGFFGTNGDASFENEEQIVKVAHLRNLYQKVGMFGMPAVPFLNAGDNGHKGNQIRGFGFLHDGGIDTVFRFFQATVFNNANGVGFNGGDAQRRQMEAFMMAFDTDLAPIVGQQITLTSTNSGVAGPRIDLLVQRAAASFTSKVLGGVVTECDVVVKGTVAGQARGWVRNSGGTFRSDRASEPLLSDGSLRNVAATAGQELTYTCVPPGSGTRIGVDRDLDTHLDRDELDAGSDPADPNSIPGSPTPTPGPTQTPTPTPGGPTPTPSPTPSPTPEGPPTPTPSVTPTPTPQGPTPTPSPTGAPTATPTPGLPTTSIRTSALTLRDDVSPPISLDGRSLRFRSAAYKGTPGGAFSPAFGTTGDPTQLGGSGGGAVLTVYNPGGTEKVVIPLPAAGWQRTGNTVNPGYKYRDSKRLSGPITQIALVNGRLALSGKGGSLYSLANAPQGSIAIRLRLGSGVEYCAVGPAKAPVASNDTTSKFVSSANAVPPAVCPPVP